MSENTLRVTYAHFASGSLQAAADMLDSRPLRRFRGKAEMGGTGAPVAAARPPRTAVVLEFPLLKEAA